MKMRTTKPTKNDKFYIRKASGGLSLCVQGKPTDKECDVLSNCVGYACGRFNEIIGEMKYPYLNNNAENFIERAISAKLSVVKKPSLGGIMVWQKGKTLFNHDGAGHVEIVERIDSENSIFTSSSSYGGKAFVNNTRTNTNGRWGLNSDYTYRGCIVNPSIGYKPYEKPVVPTKMKFAVGDEVKITGRLYGSSSGSNPGKSIRGRITKITRVEEGAKFPYNTTGDLGWVAESSVEPFNLAPEWKAKVGDIVVPIKLVDFRGVRLIQYDKKYQIRSIDKRGATLAAIRGTQRPIWATLKLDNLKEVK